MLVPNECCDIGTYQCQVPMPIRGRRQDIDLCIADIVAALNAANIETEFSCCGHGVFIGSVSLADGRRIEIYPDSETWEAHRKKHPFPKACLKQVQPNLNNDN